MEKKVRVLTVTYAPGRHSVGIDVQPVLIDDDGTETPLGARETVTTNQPALKPAKGEWGDKDVARVVREAEVEVTPAVEAVAAEYDGDGKQTRKAVKAKAAKMALRFPDMDVIF